MSDTEKAVVTVRIAGEEYTLRSAADREYAQECAEYADRMIATVIERGALVEEHKAAILAALALTDELFQARNERDALRDDLEGRAAALAASIEEVLAESDLASAP